MPAPNLIRNPTFSQQDQGWNTEGTVDYTRHYCRIITGQASQSVSVTPLASYRLRFYTQVIFKGSGELVIQPEPPRSRSIGPIPRFTLGQSGNSRTTCQRARVTSRCG
ncbi:hypothetical protein EJJ20_24995 [Pseudomonas poae]|nr:hypothetical protein EJJ20_24995 [Pseudomonas poae]